MDAEEPLARVRRLCLTLPETSERPSHGAPGFFVRGRRAFVMFMDHHHDDGRLALWCAAPPGVQDMLVQGAATHYFVPPYVGVRGWLGVRLDRGLDWDEVAAVVRDAYLSVAPVTLARAVREGPD